MKITLAILLKRIKKHVLEKNLSVNDKKKEIFFDKKIG